MMLSIKFIAELATMISFEYKICYWDPEGAGQGHVLT